MSLYIVYMNGVLNMLLWSGYIMLYRYIMLSDISLVCS
jgi:hypothetical protein